MGIQEDLRALPAMHRLLADADVQRALDEFSPRLRRWALEQVLAELRTWRRAHVDVRPESWQAQTEPLRIAECAKRLLQARTAPSLRRVINATGVVLHTNLGRAPLSNRALQRVQAVAAGYCNLEYDLARGERGSRHTHVEARLRELTGAEAALVVNNNAAAVWLVLNALAKGGEAVVSRGQLVEIGGSFRIPDIMRESGVTLREVGTTNKTRLSDYAQAIGPETRMVVLVHPSNYRIVGFTGEPPLAGVVELAHERQILVYQDLGSGALFDYAAHGVGDEPTVRASLDAGVDIVSFSGDKLLGSAQAGIIVGRCELIERLRKHPLMRALRVDKLTLAALDATLADLADEEHARVRIPVVRMLTESEETVRARADEVASGLAQAIPDLAVQCDVRPSQATVGGGALPLTMLPSHAVCLRPSRCSAQQLADALRREGEPPVVGRVENDEVWLDMRTVQPWEVHELIQAVAAVLGGGMDKG